MKIRKIKFFKKLFAVFVSFFLFCSSLFVANAQTISGVTEIGDFKVNSVEFVVSRDGFSYDGGSVSTYYNDSSAVLRLNLDSDVGTLESGDVVTVSIQLYPNIAALRNSQNNVTGSFNFYMKADSTTMSNYDIYRESTVGTTQNADKVLNTAWGDVWTCSFNDSSIGSSYDKYYIIFRYRVDADFTTYARYIYLKEFNFYYQNAQDYQTDRIIANQDDNTDKIIANENENHDETLYGGPDYEAKDDSAVNDYSSADEELNNATSDAQDDSISFINNFGSLFDSSYVGKGLLACTSIFKQLFSISWLSDVISFSLTLGIFAFILGSASSIVSRISTNYRYNEAKERRESNHNSKGG